MRIVKKRGKNKREDKGERTRRIVGEQKMVNGIF